MLPIFDRLKNIPRDFWIFIAAIMFIGFGESIFNSIFNNYLYDAFSMDSSQRMILELPRELPGLAVVFVSAVLFFLQSRKLAFFSMFLCFAGLIFIAFFSLNKNLLLIWLFIFSLGQHLFIPLFSSIGMELAKENKTGRRLGQLSSVRNFATIIGSFFIILGFKFFHFNFQVSFILSAVLFLAASFFLFRMAPGPKHSHTESLRLHKEYGLFYWLSILFGTRKQIFLTFAPWVLVTVYHQPITIIATLLTIGGIAGIIFQPILGRAIDKFGERFVLASEGFMLIFVCFGYGFSKIFLPEKIAFIIAASCFIIDQLLMSVGIARSTYLKKIAISPDHVTPTLTMSTSIDHVFSISVALAGGLIWSSFGYQYVFLFGSGIAIINLISALQIKTSPAG